MDYTKEIRSGDKKRVKTGVKTPIKRRPGCVPGGCLPFWVPERQGGREPPPGVVVLSVAARSPGGDGLPGVAFWVACLAASGCLPGMAGRW